MTPREPIAPQASDSSMGEATPRPTPRPTGPVAEVVSGTSRAPLPALVEPPPSLSLPEPLVAPSGSPAVPSALPTLAPPTSPTVELEAPSNTNTVMLDPEQQDKLMQLRAQQDQTLRERFGNQVVVMFTDLVGSTAYYEKYGDVMGRQKMLTHNALLFPIIRGSEGTVIKTIGDAIMACFQRLDDGLAAAVDMQLALQAYNESTEKKDDEIHIRIGLNAGAAIAEDGDLHGDAVNVAARIQHKAGADEILVSETMFTEGDDRFDLLGPVALKGKREAVQVYRLRWRADGKRSTQKERQIVSVRYELNEVLGRGPLGVTYKAEDLRLRIPVVLKLLHPFLARDESTEGGFLYRVQALASLSHPNILRTLDSSTSDADLPFYACEYVDAENLIELVARRGQLGPRETARLLRDVGTGLAFAHARGMVHGNLKPENVLLRSDGGLKVCDFGMADLKQQKRQTDAGPLSSPAFFAPEQVVGGRVDPRTDVYSLGAIMYFLACGKPPYDMSASFQTLRAVASGMYKPLTRLRADLPAAFVAIQERAMASNRDARFADIEEMLAALEPIAESRSNAALGAVQNDGVLAAGAGAPNGSAAATGNGGSKSAAPTDPETPAHETTAPGLPPLSETSARETTATGIRLEPDESSAPRPEPTMLIRGPLPTDRDAPVGKNTAERIEVERSTRLLDSWRLAGAILFAALAFVIGFGSGSLRSDVVRSSVETLTPPNVDAGEASSATLAVPPPLVLATPPATSTSPAATPTPADAGVNPAPPPAKETGFLTVLGKPGLEVQIDGRSIGRTPLKRFEVASGEHELRVIIPKRRPYTERLHIDANKVLTRRPKALEVSATEE